MLWRERVLGVILTKWTLNNFQSLLRFSLLLQYHEIELHLCFENSGSERERERGWTIAQ